jgi:short-subunit dehydrogenase
MAPSIDVQRTRPRLVLITGASGGIGEAFAHLLGGENCDLVLSARNDNELNRVRGLILAKHPERIVTVLAGDLSRADAGAILESELTQRGLAPDVVINNAGFGLAGAAVRRSRSDQINMIDLNVRTLTELTLRFVPAMVARKAGGIINVASTAAFMPGPYMAVYYATKAYVLSFSEALAAELEGSGVTITALCPGPVRTGFQERAQMQNSRFVQRLLTLPVDEVAEAGWQGFKQKRRVVIPGYLNLASGYAGRYLPRWTVVPMIRAVQKRTN